MRDRVSLVVFVNVGPDCKLEFIEDTIKSVRFYTTESRRILVVDDSNKGAGLLLKEKLPEIELLYPLEKKNQSGRIFSAVATPINYANGNFSFDVVLKLDTDALVTGQLPERDAIKYFVQNPHVGMLGSYRIDSNGDARDFSWPAKTLYYETASVRGLLTHPRRFVALRRVLSQALINGYEFGEHILGGAVFISSDCVRRLIESGLLFRKSLHEVSLGEDHLLGLYTKYVGMELADFATNGFPMGMRWRGLPSSPEQLVQNNKKIIHSTRFWEDQSEDQIRGFFRQHRQPAKD